MDGQQGGGVPPQFSPDGKWWWDGSKWVPVQRAQVVVPAAPAKARMPHQRPSFWIGLGVITLLLVGTGVCMAAVANSSSTQPGAKAVSATSIPMAAPTATPTPTASPSATPNPSPTPTAAPPVAAAPPGTAAPAPPPATPAGCYPLSNGGTCYEPGEFCRTSDHGRTGVAGNGEAIVCEYNNGWRWEPA